MEHVEITSFLGKHSLRYECPHCGEVLKSDISTAGADDDCPVCHARFVVPEATVSEQQPIVVADTCQASRRRGAKASQTWLKAIVFRVYREVLSMLSEALNIIYCGVINGRYFLLGLGWFFAGLVIFERYERSTPTALICWGLGFMLLKIAASIGALNRKFETP